MEVVFLAEKNNIVAPTNMDADDLSRKLVTFIFHSSTTMQILSTMQSQDE